MSKRVVVILCVDSAMLALVCVLECLDLTGLVWHEWLGFALCPLVLLHVIWQWRWFMTQFRRMRSPGASRARVNACLNLLLLAMMAAVLVSGVMVSRLGTSVIGENLGRVRIWSDVHGYLNFIVLLLVGLHLALNWDWLTAAMRRRPEIPANAGGPEGRGKSFARPVARGIAVFIVTVILAGMVYGIFYATAAPDKRVARPRVVVSNGAPPVERSIAPQPRPIDVPEGLMKLLYKVLVLGVVMLIGRFGFRLRL